jgi:hypothetical protein
VAVLGLGSSLAEFQPEEFELAIGVNDIWRHVKTDIVVCLNNPKEFTFERLAIINACTPKAFYSQMVIWDERSDFVKINFLPGYQDSYCNLDLFTFQKSFCSPFVAAQIGFKLYHASELHLYGVDLLNHPVLNGTLLDKCILHFTNLKTALKLKGCEFIVHGEGVLKNI